MSILVSGGAGYIGSVVVEELVMEGNQVVVVDNLSQGHHRALDPKAEFICTDLGDAKKICSDISQPGHWGCYPPGSFEYRCVVGNRAGDLLPKQCCLRNESA